MARRLVVDSVIALLVGGAAWFSAQAARWYVAGPGPWMRPGRPQLSTPPEIWWWPLPFVLILVLGLVLRRIRPPLGFVLVVLGVTGFLAIGGPYGPVLFAPALAMWSLGPVLPLRRWVVAVALLLVMLTAGWWRTPALGLLEPQAWAGVLFGLGAILVPALIGLVLRARRESERSLREEELRRTAYEERLRVAREVHDVVGHSLSVINLQAGVALHVLERRPEQAEHALTAIRGTSKEALAELRRTLDLFRDPDLQLAPVAGLDRLPDLIGSLRAAGREVVLDDGRGVRVSAAADQAAYRIVQESLTNVVRHTDRAVARVTLRTLGDHLAVEVSDDGPPTRIAAGNGIVGMQERAAAVGGTLTVSAGETGVRVRAELPIGVADDEAR